MQPRPAPGSGAVRSRDRRWTAALECGRLLEYEAPDLVPVVGDVVPCRRHGHCPVAAADSGRPAARRMRPSPRTQQELLDRLGRRGTASVAALRQDRFSLRLVAAAERAGLVHLDQLRGVVGLTAGPRHRIDAPG